ncbi:glucose-1-phosphate thymidylyltransferase [Oxobacter pfennigii]|uniref:Glucose-1-phosphate thymidylyltransferase n=1 Tax=Oxobacter pfennigii TaxID=36849 RepID=A0A0P8Y9D2_9CLOT|nr:sugar phosphate nucleotidyltransferase [Oxobacter pfennigii]KPU43417.1 glucose-1-phosphate thymidylyltransferase [Oxobacter pfennigii]
MKGIILAGGTGSRLYPLTKVTNKHLLPIGRYPMIYYPVSKLKEAGIREIAVITGKEHMGAVVNLLGSGYDLGAEFTYRIQDRPGGIAQALGLCRNFVGNDKCVVILGDNIFNESIAYFVEKFKSQDCGARIIIHEVKDPQRFGVAEFNKDRIVSIEEKPKFPKSNFCVTGIYMYDSWVFEAVNTLKPSGRGELEITDVNNWYIKNSCLYYDVFKDWWTDAGTFDSLRTASELAKDMNLADILNRN